MKKNFNNKKNFPKKNKKRTESDEESSQMDDLELEELEKLITTELQECAGPLL